MGRHPYLLTLMEGDVPKRLARGLLWGPEGTTVEGPALLQVRRKALLQPLADNSNLGTADEQKCSPSGVKLPSSKDVQGL